MQPDIITLPDKLKDELSAAFKEFDDEIYIL